MYWNEDTEKTKIKEKIDGISKIYKNYLEVINAYFSESLNVSDISSTYENKITEIAKKFQDADISFYGYSTLKNAILRKFGKYIEEACNELEKFCEFIRQEPEETSLILVQETGFIKYFHAIRNFFFKGAIERKKQKEIKEKQEEAKIYIQKYEIINKKIEEYNLENSIIDTIIEFAKDTYGVNDYSFGEDFIGIKDDFIKLGFESKILELEEEISKNNIIIERIKKVSIS